MQYFILIFLQELFVQNYLYFLKMTLFTFLYPQIMYQKIV